MHRFLPRGDKLTRVTEKQGRRIPRDILLWLLCSAVGASLALAIVYELAEAFGNLTIFAIFYLLLCLALGGALVIGSARLFRAAMPRSRFWTFATAPVLPALALITAAGWEMPPRSMSEAVPTGAHIFMHEGRKIAYWRRGPIASSLPPVIFVNGGPGVAVSGATMNAIGNGFAQAGFQTYFYDQAGTGLSSKLPPADYTVERMSEDIETLRRRLGANRIILAGTSWASIIIIRYLETHGANLSAVGLISPVSASGVDIRSVDFSKTNFHHPHWMPSIRLLVAIALIRRAPALAEQFMTQEQSRPWAADFMTVQLTGAMTCKGHPDHVVTDYFSAPNLYPYMLLNADNSLRAGLPAAQLRKYAVPILAVRGSCDYLPKTVAASYLAYSPDSTLWEIPGQGHGLEQTDSQAAAAIGRWLAAHARSRNPAVTETDVAKG